MHHRALTVGLFLNRLGTGHLPIAYNGDDIIHGSALPFGLTPGVLVNVGHLTLGITGFETITVFVEEGPLVKGIVLHNEEAALVEMPMSLFLGHPVLHPVLVPTTVS
mmetsp:Transcript_22743/g.18818  ORF Transcript_22743/g.18818 Transcript_22743/m.18818 type:complete len:107 (-) Transcript_22743:325-645(-)